VYPPPTVSIAASPSTVISGQVSTLTWSTTNATTCTKAGAWSGSAPTIGSLVVGPTNAGTYTYSLSCTGPDGTTIGSATLTVTPSSVPSGTAVSLTWSSTNASSCQASGAWSGPISVSGNASFTPTASGSFIYGITCMGPSGGTVSANASLMVYGQPAASLTLSAPTI